MGASSDHFGDCLVDAVLGLERKARPCKQIDLGVGVFRRGGFAGSSGGAVAYAACGDGQHAAALVRSCRVDCCGAFDSVRGLLVRCISGVQKRNFAYRGRRIIPAEYEFGVW